ncbi:MAG: DNA polymerase IV [Clostridia bacterium]|nr:DNA polymerase IV [Clostridia bacterium]
MERKILHVDMDAFFASVEQLDHPEYRGKPVIVGGVSDRGVVSTCSYEARKYGIHSAQPAYLARKLCPNGIFVHGNHKRYSEVSKAVFKILYEVCDQVQVVSIDEAYLDVSSLYYSPMYIAKYIKKRVKDEIGLTLSVGISYNKFLAKLASDWNKPDGIKWITKEMMPDILKPLSIRKVHGLGAKSVEKLNKIGIFTIGDLLGYDQYFLESFLGKYGIEIYERIHGIDMRPVEAESGERKSIGTETTLSKDLEDKEEIKKYFLEFSNKISDTLKTKQMVAKTITIKMKTCQFDSHSRSKTVNIPVVESEDLYHIACELLKEYDLRLPVRLVGISVSNLEDLNSVQLSFFDNF